MNIILSSARQFIHKFQPPGSYVIAEQIGRRFSTSTAVTSIGPYRVSCDLSDQQQRQIYFGLYEKDEAALFKQLLRTGDHVLDIGANVGYFSLLASHLVGPNGMVHAFEPVPSNVATIDAAIRENAIKNIMLTAAAVSDKAGTMTLYAEESPENSGHASLIPTQRRGKASLLPTLSIDDYLSNYPNPIRLVKLDIEGAELLALHGMHQLLTRVDSPILLCEINPFLFGKQGIDPTSITTLLAQFGYTLNIVGPDGLTPCDPTTPIDSLINILATKHDEHAHINAG